MKNEISTLTVQVILSLHIGKNNGICARDLADTCLGRAASQAEQRHLRAVIQELREQGQHICAHPATGYFIAANAEELDATCEFLYERALCSLKQISRMKKVSLPDIRGQLRLPT